MGAVTPKTNGAIYLFSTHSVYLPVWLGYQTKVEIIVLYSIKSPYFVIETECVYCAVRTESSNIA